MKIGFVGLGPMGTGMAQRLVAAGHDVAVFNRTPERAASLVAAGARLAASPAEAARDAAFVFSMLAHDDAVESLTLGDTGLAAGLAADAVHLSCSTLSVALSQRLAELHRSRGQGYLAAPVLGRPPAAASGSLFILLAGEPALAERATPVLDALAQRIFRIGTDPVQANLVKLSLNFLIFSTIEQLSEVFALNEKGGIAPALLFEVLTNSFFNAPVHKNYGKLIVDGAFDAPGAPVSLAAKDVGLLLAAGSQLGVPLPMGSLVRDRFLASSARGEQALDFTVMSRRAREDAGLPPQA